MSEPDGPSRRRVLRWMAGLGGVGFVGGVGTQAVLRERVAFSGAIDSSKLDLEIGAAEGDESLTYDADGSVSIQFEEITPGSSGRATIGVRSCNAPARVTVRLFDPAEGTNTEPTAGGNNSGLALNAPQKENTEATETSTDGSSGDEGTQRSTTHTGTPEKTDTATTTESPQKTATPTTTGADTATTTAGEGGGQRKGGVSGTETNPLYSELEVRVTVVTPDGRRTLFDGALGGLFDTLADGHTFASCVDCDPVRLVVEWALPSDASDSVSGASATIESEFVARRCGGRKTTTESA